MANLFRSDVIGCDCELASCIFIETSNNCVSTVLLFCLKLHSTAVLLAMKNFLRIIIKIWNVKTHKRRIDKKYNMRLRLIWSGFETKLKNSKLDMQSSKSIFTDNCHKSLNAFLLISRFPTLKFHNSLNNNLPSKRTWKYFEMIYLTSVLYCGRKWKTNY